MLVKSFFILFVVTLLPTLAPAQAEIKVPDGTFSVEWWLAAIIVTILLTAQAVAVILIQGALRRSEEREKAQTAAIEKIAEQVKAHQIHCAQTTGNVVTRQELNGKLTRLSDAVKSLEKELIKSVELRLSELHSRIDAINLCKSGQLGGR